MTTRERRYIRLPADAELEALYHANGDDLGATVAVIGCSPSAVYRSLARLGITRPRPKARERRSRLDVLEALVADQSGRIAALEARPAGGKVQLVEWCPDHRRKVDGGRSVRDQRHEVGLPHRLKAAS